MKMNELKFETANIDDLIPYENNPRNNDDAVEAVAASIREFGFKVPIICDKDNVIIAGHTRLKAARRLGLATVPVIRADDLTEDQVKAFRLADNKVGELATWDFEKLNIELEDIELDMSDFGFEIEFDEPEEELSDDIDEIPENLIADAATKTGDLFRLRDHLLLCGDATNADDISKLISAERVQLCLTDPPYGVDAVKVDSIGGGKPFGQTARGKSDSRIIDVNKYMPIKGDDTTDTARMNYQIIKDLTDNQIIFGGNYFTDFLPVSRCWIVWDKENTGNFADAELAWASFDKPIKIYHWLWNGLCRKGDRQTEGVHRMHPTQKPVGMLADILRDFTEEGDTVLDCFAGSGSVLIAAEVTGRKCLAVEYEPHYCDMIITRWEQITGEKAVKLNG